MKMKTGSQVSLIDYSYTMWIDEKGLRTMQGEHYRAIGVEIPVDRRQQERSHFTVIATDVKGGLPSDVRFTSLPANFNNTIIQHNATGLIVFCNNICVRRVVTPREVGIEVAIRETESILEKLKKLPPQTFDEFMLYAYIYSECHSLIERATAKLKTLREDS